MQTILMDNDISIVEIDLYRERKADQGPCRIERFSCNTQMRTQLIAPPQPPEMTYDEMIRRDKKRREALKRREDLEIAKDVYIKSRIGQFYTPSRYAPIWPYGRGDKKTRMSTLKSDPDSKMSKLKELCQDPDEYTRFEAQKRLQNRKRYQKLKKRRNRQK
jgi:hypothetical protein